MSHRTRIWDLPTRLFHWLLAACVVGLVISAKQGGNMMVWHFRLGYAVLALLVFRLAWGVVGGHWSRFAQFAYSPARLLAYLRGQGQPGDAVGHSPTGALSVFALLTVLGAQVASGLMSDDEIAFAGPLTPHVSGSVVSQATGYHAHWGQYLVIGLVALHVLAIVVYALRGQRLAPAMLHGDKTLALPAQPSRDDAASRALALALALASGALAWWVSTLG